jgi:hypothetical protein
VARYLFKNGSLGHAIKLGPVVADWPGVAVDRSGTAVVAWTEPGGSLVALAVWQGGLASSSGVTSVYARRFSSSGKFGTRRTLSSDGRVVRAAASPRGLYSVIWQQSSYPYAIRGRFGP